MFHANFNIISVSSCWQLRNSCFPWVLPYYAGPLKCLAQEYSHETKTRLLQIESIRRRQIKCDTPPTPAEIYPWKGRKRGKRRKCWFTSIFFFSHNVFKCVFVKVAETRDWLEEGEISSHDRPLLAVKCLLYVADDQLRKFHVIILPFPWQLHNNVTKEAVKNQ